MTLATGKRVGPYEIAESIGSGGMGEVYRATDTRLKRDVAIKVLPEFFASDADRVARFQREAEVLAALNHPNIAQIYGLEETDGATALVMELVDGPTLADRIAEGPMPPAEALNVAMQIAEALEAAHGRQIVHRDLKPANIKLRPDGTIKVLDFGIAKAIDAQAISGRRTPSLTTPAMTESGVIMGTAAYMAPEQARGLLVDERADIWAFGCVLHEMLTGQPAFGGEDVMATLARVIDREADLSSIPGTLSPAVRHTIRLCLEKDLRKRIADIRDVRLALEGAFESWHSAANDSGRLARRGSGALIGAGIGGLAVGALAASAIFLMRAVPAPLPADLPALPPPAPVARYLITPPPEAPLAALGGTDVAISPDGSRLAYYSEDPLSGQVELWVRDRDSLEARRLPGTRVDQSTGNLNPFFSADGTWIGFRSPGEGIMRVSVDDGGPPVRMFDDIPGYLGGTTTADGTVIFSGGDGIYRLSSSGSGTPERLSAEREAGATGAPGVAAEAAPYIGPQLLPGERAVLFAQGNENVAVLDLDTGEERVIVENGQNPYYAPSGHIVYSRGTTLMAVPFDSDELAVTGESVAVVQGVRQPGTASAADYVVSASGTLAYVPVGDGTLAPSELVWIDRRGQVVGPALTEAVDRPVDPRLSPDGTRLVLTVGASIGAGTTWVYDLSGRPPIPLANVAGNILPAWSPDGSEIAFTSNRSGSFELYRVPADGSLLTFEPFQSPQPPVAPVVWTDDGELIVVRPQGPRGADILMTTPAADDDLRDLVVTEDNEFDPALSPSGRWLAYVSDRTGQPEIWVKPHPDGVPVRVSNGGGFEPRWAQDESELYYLRGRTMMAVAVSATAGFSFEAAEELFAVPFYVSSGALSYSYDVSRDGRFLMIQPFGGAAGDASQKSIVVVQNWLNELEQRVPGGGR